MSRCTCPHSFAFGSQKRTGTNSNCILHGSNCAVYLQDTNGHRRIVGNAVDISEVSAQGIIADLLAGQTKPHKVDYDIVRYTSETKQRVLGEHAIQV